MLKSIFVDLSAEKQPRGDGPFSTDTSQVCLWAYISKDGNFY